MARPCTGGGEGHGWQSFVARERGRASLRKEEGGMAGLGWAGPAQSRVEEREKRRLGRAGFGPAQSDLIFFSF